jgi:hypothetical protein
MVPTAGTYLTSEGSRQAPAGRPLRSWKSGSGDDARRSGQRTRGCPDYYHNQYRESESPDDRATNEEHEQSAHGHA